MASGRPRRQTSPGRPLDAVDAEKPRQLLARPGRLGPGGEHLLRAETPEHPHGPHRRRAGGQHVHAGVPDERDRLRRGGERIGERQRRGRIPASGALLVARRRWRGMPTGCRARPPAGASAGPACCSGPRPVLPPTAGRRAAPGCHRRAASRRAGARRSPPGTRRRRPRASPRFRAGARARPAFAPPRRRRCGTPRPGAAGTRALAGSGSSPRRCRPASRRACRRGRR